MDSSDNCWRTMFCRILPSGYDTGNEGEVRQAFTDGMKWADEEGVQHKRHNPNHYADQYLRTLQHRRKGPILPEYMRRYCAHRLGITLAEPELQPHVVATSLPARRLRPRDRSRMSPHVTARIPATA